MMLEMIWVVTQPKDSTYTIDDILFSVTPSQLERQFKGGLRVDVDGVEFYTEQSEAFNRAIHLLNLAAHPKDVA